MDFKQLCKKIDLVFKNENEKLIMIEGFKKRNLSQAIEQRHKLT